MGKPSSTQLSKNSSSHSVKSNKSNMSQEKARVTKRDRIRKRQLKTQRSIRKLFDQLRDTSHNSSRCDSTVIDLEDSTTVPDELGTINEVSIVIPDDEQPACSTPRKASLHTSTPKRRSKLNDVILSCSNNNLRSTLDRNSLQTIDLTGFNDSSNKEVSVIDLVDTTEETLRPSASRDSSMSGDSQVTVLRAPGAGAGPGPGPGPGAGAGGLRRFTRGIRGLTAADKGKLLELITETIFNGCNVNTSSQAAAPHLQRAAPSAEDTYIREVILGARASRASVGSNVYHPAPRAPRPPPAGPRMVVIDGSNVAMEHGRGKFFSVRGLQICIDYFLRRGHVVKAFVPRFRCKAHMSSEPRLLDALERRGLVVYTPSREVRGRTIVPYDDRYIVQCAAEFGGVVVSGDNYRDLVHENPRWRDVIERRLLPFTWVQDMLMFPRDPLGRGGPSLHQFLHHP